MIFRLLRKLILALSVVVAIALLVLWIRTGQSDLVVSSARFGTYREFRIGRSRAGLLFVTTWPQDQPMRIGRVGKPSPDLILKSSAATVSSATDQNGLPLLDGSQLTLTPSSNSWWPPVRSTGAATGGMSYTANLNTGQTIAWPPTTVSIVSSGSLTLRQATSTGTLTTSPANITAKTLTVTSPTTGLPSGTIALTPGGGTTTPAPGGTPTFGSGIVTLKTNLSSSKNITLKSGGGNIASGSSVAGSGGLVTGNYLTGPSLTITGGTLILFATYTYTRYALPIWAVALIVLLPVWWAIVVETLRRRRRRIRRRGGLCERCGYDLRGNPGGSTCPECGTPTRGVPAPPTGEQLIARLK